jgi:hypothetical protein
MIPMSQRSVALALLLFVATPMMAQLERVLIPSVANVPIPGANNSSWITEILGQNLSSEIITLYLSSCGFIDCAFRQLNPNEVFSSTNVFSTSPNGAVIQVSSTQSGKLGLSARARDLSRALNTWGTELPIVRDSEVTDTPITLFNIPTSDRFRVTIRLYDFVNEDNQFVLTISNVQGQELIQRRVGAQELYDLLGRYQGLSFGVITDLGERSVEAVNIKITTVKPARFWAFASVTNNETQHVTVVSPNRPR